MLPPARIHGNGFIQQEIDDSTRVHVWLKGLPQRQRVSSKIHDHRFSFRSLVVRGEMFNRIIHASDHPTGEWRKWKALGERKPNGNRPLVRCEACTPVQTGVQFYRAGDSYEFPSREFHEIVPLRLPLVALVYKTEVLEDHVASVLLPEDLEPDQEFSRFVIADDELKAMVAEALFVGREIECRRAS